MARTDTLGHFLTDVADAIREKKGTSETITASDFDTEIENLPSGGISIPQTIAEANDLLDSIYSNLNNYYLNLPNNYTADTQDVVNLYTPSIDNQCYVIRYKSNGKYAISWVPICLAGIASSTIYLNKINYREIANTKDMKILII